METSDDAEWNLHRDGDSLYRHIIGRHGLACETQPFPQLEGPYRGVIVRNDLFCQLRLIAKAVGKTGHDP